MRFNVQRNFIRVLIAILVPSLIRIAHAQLAPANDAECLGSVCVGSAVEILFRENSATASSAASIGERGTMVGADPAHGEWLVVSQSSGGYFRVAGPALRVAGNLACVAGICRGDTARIESGASRGNEGRVIGVDARTYSATLLGEAGDYRSTSLRDVLVTKKAEESAIPPALATPCPAETIYDVFRAVCVLIGRGSAAENALLVETPNSSR